MPKAAEQPTAVEVQLAVAASSNPDSPPAIAPGQVLAFCLYPNEIVPATVRRVLLEDRLDLSTTIMVKERRRNPDREAMNPYITVWVASDRLQQRTRRREPPVQPRDDAGFPIETFALVHGTGEPGGPLMAGTWFDPRPWTLSVHATHYEEKDKKGIVLVPHEERSFGPWPGAEIREAYAAFERERQSALWDRVEWRWQLTSSL